MILEGEIKDAKNREIKIHVLFENFELWKPLG